MEIEILVPLATINRAFEKGDRVTWDREDAARLIKAGYAREVSGKPKAERERS